MALQLVRVQSVRRRYQERERGEKEEEEEGGGISERLQTGRRTK